MIVRGFKKAPGEVISLVECRLNVCGHNCKVGGCQRRGDAQEAVILSRVMGATLPEGMNH